MKIAIIGGSGYIGQNLIESLSASTDHDIISISRRAEAAKYSHKNVTAVNCSVFDTDQLHGLIKDCDIVYYLVHMMAQDGDFTEAEERAAKSLVDSTKGTSVKRIIYLGGLGADSDKLSKHLISRHHTGELLRQAQAPVIEFRASMIVGEGSVSYDIITNLVHKLPVLTLPKWAKTPTQPICLGDVITYLSEAVDVSISQSEVVEVGGPDKMSYEQLIREYATLNRNRVLLIYLPFIPISVAAWWLQIFTPPKHAKVGGAMVESLANPMLVTSPLAGKIFPNIKPHNVKDCLAPGM